MKAIAFYAVQVLAGLAAFAMGIAKLAAMGVMAQPLELMGLGQGFRLAVGSLEIIAGLCLLFPRSGLIGAVLLASLTISTFGASYGQVAGLCKQMDEVVEGNGTMLDNSVVVVGNGQEDGASHQVYPIPFMLIGNAGGALKTGGRVVRYPTKHPHNKLLATIVTAMGFPTQDYGGVAGREGVLSELLA